MFQINRAILNFGVALTLLLVNACSNNTDNQEQLVVDNSSVDSLDATGADPSAMYPWSIDFDNRTKTRNPQFRKAYDHIDSVIKGINFMYPDVGLTKTALSGDTLYTGILHPEVLSEQMGSSGAAAYVAIVVINCTSLPGIRYVSMALPGGSHLSGDVWSADQFNDYAELKP